MYGDTLTIWTGNSYLTKTIFGTNEQCWKWQRDHCPSHMLDPDWGRGKQIENSSKLNKKSIVTYSNCVPKRKY